MCSRYESPEKAQLAKGFGPKLKLPKWEFKELIYPGYQAPVILNEELDVESRFWGFVARFPGKRDPSAMIEKILQNAVSETVDEKKTFSGAWRKNQRCLIPAKSFLEPIEKRFTKIIEPDEDIVVMAGIYSNTTYKGQQHQAFTMLTCEPNKFMQKFHDRMPVILPREKWQEWLSPDTTPEQAIKLCRPYAGKLSIVGSNSV